MNFGHDDAALGARIAAPAAPIAPPQVLVVGDFKDVRDCIGVILRSGGYRVLEAEDGLEAQLILSNAHPDLVISDLEMPVSDGWDVLTFCHAQHPGTPVLIVSGGALGQRPDIECWAAGFLPKPFDLARFRAELHRLIPLAA